MNRWIVPDVWTAIRISERLLDHGKGNYWADDYLSALEYLIEFARTLASVPTAHDQEQEMADWDAFIEERKARVNVR